MNPENNGNHPEPQLCDALFNILDTGIIYTDRTFRIIYVNQWMNRHFPEMLPLAGRHCFDDLFGPRGDTPRFTDMDGQACLKMIRRVHRRDQTSDWFTLSVCIWKDSADSDRGAIVQVRDISEFKAIEARLADEVYRRRVLLEQSRDGIVIINHNGRVIEANQRYADMLGYSLAEVCELHVWDWDDQWSRAELLEMIATVDHTGDHFETSHRRKDGSFYDVEISTNGVVFGGEKQVLCICRDITESKRAEREREGLIRKLQAALKEIKTLKGILPLCSFCKKIRNSNGNWEPVDIYLHHHSQADVSHSICPQCMREHYPDECDD